MAYRDGMGPYGEGALTGLGLGSCTNSLTLSNATARITTNPPGAIIYTGVEEIGITPPTGSLNIELAPGYYQFRAVKEGYTRAIYEVTLESGEEIDIHMNLVSQYQKVFPYLTVGIPLLFLGYYIYKMR